MPECDHTKGATAIKTACYTIGQIVRQFGQRFVEMFQPSFRVQKVLQNIANCRTAALGGHLVKCSACGYEKTLPNSCGDSNCPQCQNIKKELWIDKMCHHLLPVRHFHIIFTVPHELNDLFFYNQQKMYALFFRSAWKTIEQVTGEGDSGMIATLHSWGSNLSYHPHLHCIVPKGTLLSGQWHENVPTNARFFVKSELLRETFKEIFLKGLLHLIDHDILYLEGLSMNDFSLQKIRKIYHQIQGKKWSVRIEAPILGTQQIIEYLGRYVKRVAITNSRILEVTDKMVTFEYKKYAEQQPGKPAPKDNITMDGEKFMQRFSQHILPRYFQRVRYYGLYAFSCKTKKAIAFQAIEGLPQTPYQKPLKRQLLQKMLGTDPDVCPNCACYQTLILLPLTVDRTQYFSLLKYWVNPAVKLKPKLTTDESAVAAV